MIPKSLEERLNEFLRVREERDRALGDIAILRGGVELGRIPAPLEAQA